MPSPPFPSPPPSPPSPPSGRPPASTTPSTTNPFLQPLNPVHSSVLAASSPPAAVSATRLSRSPTRASNVLTAATGSPPASGPASSPPPPAPPAPELAFTNEQILSMLRPLVRVLHDRGVLNSTANSAPPSSSFPQPSMHITTGTGTSGIPHSLTTKHEEGGTSRYVTINMKDALQNKSLEELRLEDYNLARASHPLSTTGKRTHIPVQPGANNDSNTANNASSFKRVSFSNAATFPNAAASRFGAPNHVFKYPWFPLVCPNNASGFNASSISTPVPFASTFEHASQPANSRNFANNNSNNCNSFATNWLSDDAARSAPNSCNPSGNAPLFMGGSHPFCLPSGAQCASNATAPFGSSAAPGDGEGNNAAEQRESAGLDRFGGGGYSQTVTHKQTFTTPGGENHGPVFNEIRVSQTAYLPHGWFW
eukprot:TRINITY_DN1413_c0_g1_i1.p1 TRINITY_DN1413_c0_g1~~TRINITY_DN1413_c0_g1_i1.p1  ORF type:complete len:424 (+),score=65.33 TRINITY_DN1413_c0_g1_i1:2837-4108(+)